MICVYTKQTSLRCCKWKLFTPCAMPYTFWSPISAQGTHHFHHRCEKIFFIWPPSSDSAVLFHFNGPFLCTPFDVIPFLAHLSQRLKWAFLIKICPLSAVGRCRRRCCCCCRKLFTFSSSSPGPLGQFQPNLAQSILGWREFKYVQMKGPTVFQREIITK